MVDLSTEYMGLELSNPLVPSASPLSRHIDTVRHLEDLGASAIVVYSIFEEQISHEAREFNHYLNMGTESFAESLTYFPEPHEFYLGPDEYLEHIQALKKAVDIPVIGSLNGSTLGGWTDYAKKIEQAGADAIELNVYFVPTDPYIPSNEVERTYIDILKAVKTNVTIPVAVKLSPYFSSVAYMARQLDQAGADALVLFNRFYQPDLDLETLEVGPNLIFSTPQAMRLPLRWTAILYGWIKSSIAATSGIHTAEDCIKMIMAGADVTMVCSTLLIHGVDRIDHILRGMRAWMEEHEYDSVQMMKGSMSQQSCPNPASFERAQYMKTLASWH